MPAQDPLADRIEQPERDGQLADRRGLSAGQHQTVDLVELRGAADRPGQRVALGEGAEVFAYVALQGEHTDGDCHTLTLRSGQDQIHGQWVRSNAQRSGTGGAHRARRRLRPDREPSGI